MRSGPPHGAGAWTAAADRERSAASGEAAVARRAQARLSLLSKVGALAGSLDYEQTLAAVARLSIPELADWCFVDVVEDGRARRTEVAHRDTADASLAEAFRRFPLDHVARRGLPAARALRSGQPVLVAEFTDEMLREQTQGEFLELARRLGPFSEIAIPVRLSSARATVLFLVTSESGRRYGPEDVALAEEVVRRAAQVVESARVHQRLRQTEERYRVALAHSSITLFEQDVAGRYRWVYNPPLGYRAADVLGKRNDELLPPDEAAHLDALDRAVLERGERVHEEIRISDPAGQTRHMLLSQEPLRDGAGAIVGLTGAATDITAQKQARDELEQALAFREQMMGILGHDLRNPLSAVRGLTALMLRRDDLPENVREALAEIGRAGKRMLELIGTLLDFTESRFHGGLPIARAPMDLHEVCRAVVAELLAADPGREIELDLTGDGRGAWDAARIAQVLSNLTGNALEHGAKDAPVRVSVRDQGDDVVLAVANRGPAIAPETLPTLFEPFRRGRRERDASRARGLGLGLYIVRQVVDAHGGAVDVASTAEGGTTFTVRLPRAAVPAPIDAAAPDAAGARGDAA